MKEEIKLTELNKPAVWVHREHGKPVRYYLAYERKFHQFPIKGRSDYAFQHAVAIEIFPHKKLPKGLPKHFLKLNSLIVRPLLRIVEGELERLPVDQFGMSRHCATCAMAEAEYFTEFPTQCGKTALWKVNAKTVSKKLASATMYKNHSHVWKMLAWLNWEHWNRYELPYKERTAILLGCGFSLGAEALKSSAQEMALTIPQSRRK